MITVVIPVGPSPSNKQWLEECLDSVKRQTYQEDVQIVVIDDGSGIGDWMAPGHTAYDIYTNWIERPLTIFRCPWRTGISHAFNYGVSIAEYECVFLLGSDDTLEPTCLERCWEAYQARKQQPAYYSVPVRYLSSGEVQTIPCNAAMVTKQFWKMTGGFPIESAIGRGDNALLSICMNRPELPVVFVGHETGHPLEPLYNYREHPGQWTPYASKFAPELLSIIDKLTRDWTPPDWANNYD